MVHAGKSWFILFVKIILKKPWDECIHQLYSKELSPIKKLQQIPTACIMQEFEQGFNTTYSAHVAIMFKLLLIKLHHYL